jgi:hypothetical protein
MDNEECGVDGAMFGRGNKSTRRRPTPVPLCATRPELGLNPGTHGGEKRLTARTTALWCGL